jgi:hypothetical protein
VARDEKPEWRDHYRGEESEGTFGRIRIIVHRRYDNPGKWHVSVYLIGLENRPLEAKTLEKAKQEAVLEVKTYLTALKAEASALGQRLSEGDKHNG